MKRSKPKITLDQLTGEPPGKRPQPQKEIQWRNLPKKKGKKKNKNWQIEWGRRWAKQDIASGRRGGPEDKFLMLSHPRGIAIRKR